MLNQHRLPSTTGLNSGPTAAPTAGCIKRHLNSSIKFWVVVLTLLAANTVLANQPALRFENASTYLDDGIYYLDAFARLEIGDEPEEALMNGVELHFLVEIVVQRNRRWWIDTPVIERRLRYKLYFYELTRHYRVDNLQTGESDNYRSLTAAMRYLVYSEYQCLS